VTDSKQSADEHWDYYACEIDDWPASIMVNLGIKARAPVAGFDHRAFVILRFKQVRENGLPTSSELDTLRPIEDAVEQCLASDDVLYVGRTTANGSRDFWFFVRDPEGWDARARAALSELDQDRLETGTASDPAWEAYFDFLYPNALGHDYITNHRVCRALEEHGDPLTEPREIMHWAHFPDAAMQDAFAAEAVALGFTVCEKMLPDDEEKDYGVRFSRVDVPSFAGIHDVTVPLLRAAEAHGGEYDGWESIVLKPGRNEDGKDDG
jgi:uncharacterized protein (TIGR01619 family)